MTISDFDRQLSLSESEGKYFFNKIIRLYGIKTYGKHNYAISFLQDYSPD